MSSLALQVDATDDRGLQRIVPNIYRASALVTVTGLTDVMAPNTAQCQGAQKA